MDKKYTGKEPGLNLDEPGTEFKVQQSLLCY